MYDWGYKKTPIPGTRAYVQPLLAFNKEKYANRKIEQIIDSILIFPYLTALFEKKKIMRPLNLKWFDVKQDKSKERVVWKKKKSKKK